MEQSNKKKQKVEEVDNNIKIKNSAKLFAQYL